MLSLSKHEAQPHRPRALRAIVMRAGQDPAPAQCAGCGFFARASRIRM